MIIRFLFFLLFTCSASAAIELVRSPFILRGATAKECEFIAEVVRSVSRRQGLKDRTFLAPDHRIFAMFESPGRVLARFDDDLVIVSFQFDGRDRTVCDSIHREVGKVLLERFGSRMERPTSNPTEPNQRVQPTAPGGRG